MKDILENF